MKITIDYNKIAYRELMRNLQDKKKQIKVIGKEQMKSFGELMFITLKNKMPEKTGKLKKSLKISFKSWNEARIYTNSKYAGFLEHGTKRHFIKPKKGKALKWGKGKFANFSKGHWVKGIKKHGFFEQTYDLAKESSNFYLKQIINKLSNK